MSGEVQGDGRIQMQPVFDQRIIKYARSILTGWILYAMDYVIEGLA
jgi:hypothetical protein